MLTCTKMCDNPSHCPNIPTIDVPTFIGGNLAGTIINHMLYADDTCIVSLSSSGLQHLLNICSDYCERHDLMI